MLHHQRTSYDLEVYHLCILKYQALDMMHFDLSIAERNEWCVEEFHTFHRLHHVIIVGCIRQRACCDWPQWTAKQ